MENKNIQIIKYLQRNNKGVMERCLHCNNDCLIQLEKQIHKNDSNNLKCVKIKTFMVLKAISR